MDNHTKGRILVFVQFLLLGGIVLFSSADIFGVNKVIDSVGVVTQIFGFIVVIMGFRGLGNSLTANPVPIKSGKLITSGIYSRLRHPVYVGLILATLGMFLTSGSLVKLSFWLMLASLFALKIKFEESMLLNTYPNYKNYMEQVPAFFPKFKL